MINLEKLGIKPIEKYDNQDFYESIYLDKDVKELEQQRNNLLTKMINDLIFYDEEFRENKSPTGLEYIKHLGRIMIIESIIGKSLTEIKGLIDKENIQNDKYFNIVSPEKYPGGK